LIISSHFYDFLTIVRQ